MGDTADGAGETARASSRPEIAPLELDSLKRNSSARFSMSLLRQDRGSFSEDPAGSREDLDCSEGLVFSPRSPRTKTPSSTNVTVPAGLPRRANSVKKLISSLAGPLPLSPRASATFGSKDFFEPLDEESYEQLTEFAKIPLKSKRSVEAEAEDQQPERERRQSSAKWFFVEAEPEEKKYILLIGRAGVQRLDVSTLEVQDNWSFDDVEDVQLTPSGVSLITKTGTQTFRTQDSVEVKYSYIDNLREYHQEVESENGEREEVNGSDIENFSGLVLSDGRERERPSTPGIARREGGMGRVNSTTSLSRLAQSAMKDDKSDTASGDATADTPATPRRSGLRASIPSPFLVPASPVLSHSSPMPPIASPMPASGSPLPPNTSPTPPSPSPVPQKRVSPVPAPANPQRPASPIASPSTSAGESGSPSGKKKSLSFWERLNQNVLETMDKVEEPTFGMSGYSARK